MPICKKANTKMPSCSLGDIMICPSHFLRPMALYSHGPSHFMSFSEKTTILILCIHIVHSYNVQLSLKTLVVEKRPLVIQTLSAAPAQRGGNSADLISISQTFNTQLCQHPTLSYKSFFSDTSPYQYGTGWLDPAAKWPDMLWATAQMHLVRQHNCTLTFLVDFIRAILHESEFNKLHSNSVQA